MSARGWLTVAAALASTGACWSMDTSTPSESSSSSEGCGKSGPYPRPPTAGNRCTKNSDCERVWSRGWLDATYDDCNVCEGDVCVSRDAPRVQTDGDCIRRTCEEGLPASHADESDVPPDDPCAYYQCRYRERSRILATNGTPCGEGRTCHDGICVSYPGVSIAGDAALDAP